MTKRKSTTPTPPAAPASTAAIESKASEALLPEADIDQIEALCAPASGDSQYRRMGLCMLARSADQLAEWARSERPAGETIADIVIGVERTAARYRALADLLERSASRLKVAIFIRDDAIDLLELARKSHLDAEAGHA